MPVRTNGGVFNDQMLTGSLRHFVLESADFSGAVNEYGQAVPFSAAEIIFTNISRFGYINIMNPNQYNISFALEGTRSDLSAADITALVRSLGNDVGVDHVDCSNLTCTEVPYIFAVGGSGGATTFLQLTDTPNTYAGSANYVVTVNPSATGLIFTPNTGGTTNAFAHVAVPSQPTINAGLDDTLTLVAGANISLTTNAGAKSVTINSTGGSNTFTNVAPGGALQAGQKYFITGAGTVILPPTTGLPAGSSITVSKAAGNPTPTVFVNVGTPTDIILTDLGSTDSLEMDSSEAALFVLNGNTWHLQIGSYNH